MIGRSIARRSRLDFDERRRLHVEAEHADARMTGYVYLNLALRPSQTFHYLSVAQNPLHIMSIESFSTCGSVDDDCGGGGTPLALFAKSLDRAETYPTNIVYPHDYEYQLREYEELLQQNRSILFGSENVVDFLEFHKGSCGEPAPGALIGHARF